MNATMRSGPGVCVQRGGSLILIIVVLAVLGVLGFVGLQYVPQSMESGKIDTILTSINRSFDETPVTTEQEVKELIAKRLEINEMLGMNDAFSVKRKDGGFLITVSYERELNLLYEKRPMKYEKTLLLEP